MYLICYLPHLVDLFMVFFFLEVSAFLHACEGDAVTKLTNEKIPFFNAPIFLQNKTQIGKVDEIFGPINEAVSSLTCLSVANFLWNLFSLEILILVFFIYVCSIFLSK